MILYVLYTFKNQLVMNALMCASEEGNLNGLEELLNATRVDLNAANELGETAVHIAAGSGQLEILQYLQYRGANVAVADKHGDTPLYWASRHGHVHVVNYLLKESIPVNCLNK
uniref:Uncharacterized protein n=1 Tax=Romanomermis culicivorax TaxID=13658 RepID=A0A915HN46_ROMCU